MDFSKLEKYNDSILLITNYNIGEFKDNYIFGFSADKEKIYINSPFPDSFNKDDINTIDQCCVYLEKKQEQIIITTDRIGYGTLYCWNDGGEWAICNSLGYLVNYLKNLNIKISVNTNFTAQYLTGGCTPFTYKDTFFNEIELIPKYFSVNIDIINKTYSLKLKEISKPVSIISEQGLYLIDKWANKWIGIFNGLVNNGIHIQLDLSGGMDSRITFALVYASNIDINKIAINSNKSVSNEDFEIASKISNIYKFSLNQKMLNTFPMGIEDIIKIFTISKKYFHLSTQPRHFWDQLNVRLTGFSGELRRGTWRMSLKKYYKQYMWQAFGKELVNKAFNNLIASITDLVDVSEELSDETPIMEILYKNSRMRWHFGGATYSELFLNRLLFSPLSDPILDLIHQDDIADKNFLYAFIIERFAPELEFLNFDKHRIISSNTYEFARKLNKGHTFKKDNIEFKFDNLSNNQLYNYNQATDDYYYKYLRKQLEKEKYLFNKNYPPCIIDHAIHAKSLYATKVEPILALCEFM